MSDDEPIRISDFHEGTDGRTPCARCGALIALDATKCSECGVHFLGRAADFSPAFAVDSSSESEDYQFRDRPMMRWAASILLFALCILTIAGLIAAFSA